MFPLPLSLSLHALSLAPLYALVHAFPLSQKVYALQAIAGTRRDEEWKPRPELCNVDTERDLAKEKGSGLSGQSQSCGQCQAEGQDLHDF